MAYILGTNLPINKPIYHALQKIYDFEIINLAENYSDKSTFGLITKNWYTK